MFPDLSTVNQLSMDDTELAMRPMSTKKFPDDGCLLQIKQEEKKMKQEELKK